jgi:hypothetical protein
VTESDIAAVIAKVPRLNAFGVAVYCGVPLRDRAASHDRDQAELLADVDGCTRAESWLRGRNSIKTVSCFLCSYGLKHIAEREVGYITNGAFIAAAIHCGFPYKLGENRDPNVMFGISRRSL